MKWITNTYDPERKDAKYHLEVYIDQSRDEAWENHLAWLSDFTIGEPKACKYTVGELKQNGYVGVYKAS